MGDNKISEAVGAACSAFNATDGMLPSRMHAAIEAALPFILSVDDAQMAESYRLAHAAGEAHGKSIASLDSDVQGEAVPVAWQVEIPGKPFSIKIVRREDVAWEHAQSIHASYGEAPDIIPLYTHPQPAELSEVSGNSGELDCPRADSLLREVCAQLDAVGCGACVGSMAPMEDLHGRIMQHLSYGSANEEQEIDDLTELLNQLSMRLPSKLMDRVSAALAATGKQQVGEEVEDDRFPGGFADAIAYVNELEELAETLHAKVFGHESDGESGASTLLQMTIHQLDEKSEQVGEAQGDALDIERVLSLADVHAEESREDGVRLLDRGGLMAFVKDVASALASRQPKVK